MMPVGLLMLILFGVFFFFVLPIIGLVLWLASFNKQGIVLNEVGEDENDAIVKYVKLKTVQDRAIGGVIKFYPFSPFKMCKQFDSRDFTSIKTKKKLKEGIIVYKQGNNYRPVELRQDAEGFFLNVRDEDNRKFQMQHDIMKDRKREEYGVMKWAIISFFGFLAFIGLVGITFMWLVMDGNTKAYFVYQGAQIIAG